MMPKKIVDTKIPYRNRNHTDWWIASYIIRFVFDFENETNLKSRCLAWENTILVKAKDREEAYSKAIKFGRSGCPGDPTTRIRKYNKMQKGHWHFEGLSDLNPIYNEIKDGSEISWTEYQNFSLKRIRRRVCKKNELTCFKDE